MESKSTPRRRRSIDTDQFLRMVARMIRSAGKRAAGDDAELLQDLIGLRDQLDGAIIDTVRGLRASGHTWQQIGAATGTTRQAAIMKWAKKVA